MDPCFSLKKIEPIRPSVDLYRFGRPKVIIDPRPSVDMVLPVIFISYRQNTDKNLDCVWSRGFTDTCLYFVCTNKKFFFSIRTESVQISIWTRQISVRFRSSNLDQIFFRTPYAHLCSIAYSYAQILFPKIVSL